jgi:hypothetical protein
MSAFAAFAGRSILVHTLTYLVFGLAARSLLDYDRLWGLPLMADLYRPLDSPWVLAGPLLQPLRGLVFAAGLWPLRDAIFGMERGWLVLWGLFLAFAILGTAAAAPGSIEGVIYTKLPGEVHWTGSPEVYGQTLAYSWLLFHWQRAHATEGATILALKAVCVLLAAFFGMVLAGLLSAAALGVDVETLAQRPGATAALLAACLANLALAVVIGRRAENGSSPAGSTTLTLFYAANALPSLAVNAVQAPAGIPLGLAVQALPAVLAFVAARALFRAPESA